jgi:hypothetical protein
MCVPVHKIYQAFRLACIQELIHRGGPSMKRSFDRDTFYSVAPYSSLADFGRHSCRQENTRRLAGLSFEETIEFETLEALSPVDGDGNIGWTFEGEPTAPREKRWLALYRKHERALEPKLDV